MLDVQIASVEDDLYALLDNSVSGSVGEDAADRIKLLRIDLNTDEVLADAAPITLPDGTVGFAGSLDLTVLADGRVAMVTNRGVGMGLSQTRSR